MISCNPFCSITTTIASWMLPHCPHHCDYCYNCDKKQLLSCVSDTYKEFELSFWISYCMLCALNDLYFGRTCESFYAIIIHSLNEWSFCTTLLVFYVQSRDVDEVDVGEEQGNPNKLRVRKVLFLFPLVLSLIVKFPGCDLENHKYKVMLN